MFKTLRKIREASSEENTFFLTNRSLFQNTTLIAGSSFSAPDNRGVRHFHGYTFLPDSQSVPDTFSKGFSPEPIRGKPMYSSVSSSHNIISYVCHYAAHRSSRGKRPFNNIYLIDIRDVGGIVRVPTANSLSQRDGYEKYDCAFVYFPITRQVYRVETSNTVSGKRVVGVVGDLGDFYTGQVSRLQLYVNKNYMEGMRWVKNVVDLFNGDGWEVID